MMAGTAATQHCVWRCSPPLTTLRPSLRLQSADWTERDGKLVWTLRNLKGGTEHTLRARLTVEPGAKEAGEQGSEPAEHCGECRKARSKRALQAR